MYNFFPLCRVFAEGDSPGVCLLSGFSLSIASTVLFLKQNLLFPGPTLTHALLSLIRSIIWPLPYINSCGRKCLSNSSTRLFQFKLWISVHSKLRLPVTMFPLGSLLWLSTSVTMQQTRQVAISPPPYVCHFGLTWWWTIEDFRISEACIKKGFIRSFS